MLGHIASALSQQKTVFIVEVCLPSRFLAIEIYSCGADHLENISTVLLTARVCWTVYRAFVWQRSNQIRYNITLKSQVELGIGHLLSLRYKATK
jgi:hypothetical protein